MALPRPEQRFHYLPAATVFLIGVMIAIALLHADDKTATKPAVDLVKALIWPFFLAGIIFFFQEHVISLFDVLVEKISAATDISLWKLSIKTEVGKIPPVAPSEDVTLNNVALLHTSFIRPDKTKLYADGLNYYKIEIIVVAASATLDRIESVTYDLDPSYPKNRYVIEDRMSRFKLKELANGTSIVRATIKFRDQESPLQVNRFIDLRPDGFRI